MTVETIRPRSFSSALNKLYALTMADESVVFRGHTKIAYRLQTSLERYWPIPRIFDGPLASYPVDKFLSHYRDGLTRVGLNPLGASDAWLDWLEHARHYGAPAPLLDFSWSPYVALFFAFNGVRNPQRRQASVVYALNITRLERNWALRRTPDPDPGFDDVCHQFQKIEESDRNADDLRFIPCPGLQAERMQRQLGAFLYCTLDYAAAGVCDLEDFLDKIDEKQDARRSPIILPSNGPVLTKIVFRHEWAKEVFEHLELMNIKGGTLLLSAEGVAMDVWNGYHYTPKATRLRRGPSDKPMGQAHSD
jgi:hypothetical protein